MDSTRRIPHKVTQERRGQRYRVGASAAKPKVLEKCSVMGETGCRKKSHTWDLLHLGKPTPDYNSASAR